MDQLFKLKSGGGNIDVSSIAGRMLDILLSVFVLVFMEVMMENLRKSACKKYFLILMAAATALLSPVQNGFAAANPLLDSSPVEVSPVGDFEGASSSNSPYNFMETAFLCSFRKGQMSLLNKHTKALAIISTVWIGFVLILFSFSATKLPHHSASIYVPLSFIVSLIIYHHWKNSSQVSSLTVSFFIISSVTISAALIALPQLAEQFLEQDNINFTLKWPNEIYIMNGLFIGLIFIAGALFRSRKIAYGVACTAIAAFIFSQTLWRHYVPTYLSYSQQPLINMIKEVKGEGGKIAFYRFISFAAIYYGEEPIEMLGTSKFEGDFSILDKAQSDNIYIFTADRNNRERLIKEHPLVKLLEIRGVFAKFILSKK